MKNNKKNTPLTSVEDKSQLDNTQLSQNSQANELDLSLIKPINGKVDAKNLHKFLQVKREFSHWIRERLEKAEAVENENYDLIANAKNDETIGIRKSGKTYLLTMDLAEDISMMTRSSVAQQVRNFYKECRKQIEKQSTVIIQRDVIQNEEDMSLKIANDLIHLITENRKQRALNELLQKENTEIKSINEHHTSVILDMTVDVPLKTKRAKINEVIRYKMPQFGKRITDEIKKSTEYKSYLIRCANYSKARWNKLYHEFDYRFNKNIKTSSENRGMKPLDYAEQYNHLNNLYLLSLELFEKDQSNELRLI